MSIIGRTFAVGAVALLGFPVAASAHPVANAAEDTKTAAQIWADTQAAMKSVKSFHVLGQVTQQGSSVELNLSMSPGRGGGSVQLPGVTMELVLDAGTVYVKADEKSWLKLTGSKSTAELVANRWISAPASNADFASFAQLADSRQFIGSLSSPGKITRLPATTTWAGRKAVVLVDGTGSKLYVADTGAPYMLDIQSPTASGGSLKFSDFGDAPMPSVPKNALGLPA